MADDGDQNPRFFVAVHVGAGFHSPSNEKAYKRAIKKACLAAASILRKVSPKIFSLLLVFSFLELNSSLFGSNLKLLAQCLKLQ